MCTAPNLRFLYDVPRAMLAVALNGVSEHRVEPLLSKKEPLQCLTRGGSESECLRTTRVRHDAERLEAKGE
jgi:hypothetical protein